MQLPQASFILHPQNYHFLNESQNIKDRMKRLSEWWHKEGSNIFTNKTYNTNSNQNAFENKVYLPNTSNQNPLSYLKISEIYQNKNVPKFFSVFAKVISTSLFNGRNPKLNILLWDGTGPSNQYIFCNFYAFTNCLGM